MNKYSIYIGQNTMMDLVKIEIYGYLTILLQMPKNFLRTKGILYRYETFKVQGESLMDRVEVFEKIRDRITCDNTCEFKEFCPSMPDGVLANDCIIRRDYKKVFDSFYNLYLGKFDGLKSEMVNVAYRIKEQSATPEEELTYFNSLVKIMNSCYAPEKEDKKDMITDVMISITPVGKK